MASCSTSTGNRAGRIRQGLLLAFCASFLFNACAKDKPVAPAVKERPGATASLDSIVLGMGCFWGAEKRMAAIPGVVDVESGYANGDIEASYKAVLAHENALRTGKARQRNHAEVVKVSFDPARVDLKTVLIQFWESHDPTQGDRQGNDVGSNYRSAIYSHDEAQQAIALNTRAVYQKELSKHGFGAISTEIAALKNYRAAEDYHQDYLQKHPNGYCGLGGTGVKYPDAGRARQPDRPAAPILDGKMLDFSRQLVVFEAEDCAYCEKFKADILDHWRSGVALTRTLNPHAPTGWALEKPLFATPTIVLFEKGKEVARQTGYSGDKAGFWKWLGTRGHDNR